MEQHPVPQDITSYRFRLVGDMTLKQFLELASGVIFAWIIYVSPLNPIIKWPLLVFSASLGAALAFLPIEERPLDVWIANFLKAIYRPTQFLWQKTPFMPDFLKPGFKKATPKVPAVSPKDRQQLEEYLRSLPFEEGKVDKEEKKKLERINQFFQEAGLLISRKKPAPPPSPPAAPQPFYEPKMAFEKLQEERTREEVLKETGQLKEPPKPPQKIPESVVLQRPEGVAQGPPIIEPAEPFAPPLKVKTDVVYKKPQEKIEEVQVAPSLPIPSTPTVPNILVGMTLTPKEEILPEAIIEIIDKDNYPVRALRSNKLGQFFIATPLPRGEYQIEVEHPDYKFAIMKIKLNGKIIPPLKIKAKEKKEI